MGASVRLCDIYCGVVNITVPGVCAPVHGVDFSQMSSQCSPRAHLDPANRIDVGCDLKTQ